MKNKTKRTKKIDESENRSSVVSLDVLGIENGLWLRQFKLYFLFQHPQNIKIYKKLGEA